MTIPRLLLSQRFYWLLAAVCTLLATAFWARGVIASNDPDALLHHAGSFTVWGMHACVVAIVAGLGALAPTIRRLLGDRRLLTALGFVVLGYLACGLAPRLNRILFDEHIYMQIGQTLAHTGRAECASYARTEYGNFDLVDGWVNKQPNGLPYLHALSYRVFGASVAVSHQLNRVIIGLAAAALYLALALAPWRLPKGTAAAAAALFLFTPLVPWWGHTTAVEPAAAATAILAFLAAVLYLRLRDPDTVQGSVASSLFLAGATAFAAYFRPESLLVFPLVAAVLWSEEDRFMKDFFAWAALALALALILPNALQLFAVRNENWGATDGRRFDFAFIAQNFRSNAGYFFTSTWFPLAGTALALLGYAWLLGQRLATAVVLTVWFAFSWGIFVLFYAGGYHYGASSRYAVVSCAPVAFAMGVGLAWLLPALRRRPLFGYAFAAIFLLNWTSTFVYAPTETREAASAREDVRFIEQQAARLPHAALVLSRAPTAWLLEGRNATDLHAIQGQLETGLRELVRQYPGGIYLHFGYWDNCEPAMARDFARLITLTEASEIARRPCQEHIFALYRLDTPAAIERFGGPPPAEPDRIERLDALLVRTRQELLAPPPDPAPPAPSS